MALRQDPPHCLTSMCCLSRQEGSAAAASTAFLWLLSWASARSCPRPNHFTTLETAWILEVLCKYLQNPTQPVLRTGTSDLVFKPLPQASPPQHMMGSMYPSISCCLPNASRFILSLAPPRAFIGAQGLTSGSGRITKGCINPICLGSCTSTSGSRPAFTSMLQREVFTLTRNLLKYSWVKFRNPRNFRDVMGMLPLCFGEWERELREQPQCPAPSTPALFCAAEQPQIHLLSSLDVVVSLNKNTASNNPENMPNPRSKLIFHLWSG